MGYKGRKSESKILVKQVPEDKSKIKFVAVFEGEMDWNQTFGMQKEDDSSICHDYTEFRYGDGSFSQSLINFIFRMACGNDDYFKIFQKAHLTKLEVSNEVDQAYKEFKDEIKSREKLEKLEKLKKAEKEVAKLRSEVLSEFKK